MKHATKITAIVLGSILTLIVVVVVAAIIVVHTGWFQNFVREKIISSVEDATGGKVDVQAFNFDSSRMTATVSGFVIHGTEPPGRTPLFAAPRIVLTMKLLSSLHAPFILEYLSVDRPSANVIAFADGRTNIPEPKKKSISNKSGLQTIVDLAIRHIEIDQGTLNFLQQTTPLDLRGNNLRVTLAYNLASEHYQGGLSLEPLIVQSAGRPPLQAKIEIPVDLGGDAIQIANARIATPQSAIYANFSLQHMASPVVSAQVVAHVSLEEVARSVSTPLHPRPGLNTVDLSAAVNTTGRSMQIHDAVATLGQTRVTALGDLRKGAEIRATLKLDELGALLALAKRPSGTVQVAGTAEIPQNAPYSLAGTIESRDLGYDKFRNIHLAAGFRDNPNTLAVNGFTVDAFGGELRADARLENFETYHATASLRDFTIRNLSSALMNRPINYAGSIGGAIEANGVLKGAMAATADLKITPTGGGVPVSGNLDASYESAHNLVSLHQSQINLPNTRISLVGDIGKTADIRVESRSLDDFAPVANVGSTVRLQGGSGTLTIHETGPVAAAQISGRVRLTKFTLESRPFDQLSAELQASPSQASLSNGLLKRSGTETQFSGSIGLQSWKPADNAPLSVSLTSNSDIADLIALAGSDARVNGPLNANIAIQGTLANPRGSAQIHAGPGTAYDEPYDAVQLNANLADQRVDLTTLDIAAGSARFQASGSFTHPRDSFASGRIQLHAATNPVQLAQFKTLQKKRPGIAGTVTFDSDLVGQLKKAQKIEFKPSAVNAKFSATGVHDNRENYGNLTATAATSGSNLNTRVDSDLVGSRIQITARTQLKDGYPSDARASISSLNVEKAIALASSGAPQVTGTLSAQGHFNGTLDDPHADLAFDLATGSILNQPVTRVDGKASYTGVLAAISSLSVTSPAGSVNLHGSFQHNAGDLHNGKIDLHVSAPSLQLQKVDAIAKTKPGFGGTARLIADVAADLHEREILPSKADIEAALNDLQFEKKSLGSATFEGHTSGDVLAMKLEASLAGSEIHGTGQAQLRGDYHGDAHLSLANVRYSSLESILGSTAPFEALLEGHADFTGPFRHAADGSGSAQITKLEVSSNENPITIRNEGPIAFRFQKSDLDITSAHFAGPSTNINLSGKVGLNRRNPLDLTLNAQADLAILKNFNRSAYSSGSVSANVRARGTFAKPQINGRVDLKDASFQMADWPDGISKANGEILLNGTNARINSITAEVGGGKVTVDGSCGYTSTAVDFDIRANAQKVRMRYSGASITADAAVTVSGTSQRGLLGGTVTITKVGYSSQTDIGAILSGANTPPGAPVETGFPARMRLNIHVQTSPGIRFQTSLAEQLSASADLKVLGTLASPGIVGRVNVNAGTLVFFGNKYTVNRGAISFYSATTIQPVLDVDLQTAAQGVTVDLTVSGPIDNMKLSYRSDPPLKFEDIIALLATGKTPPDPTIAVNQPAPPDQGALQMGESAVVGQAIANPVANRLQRVFGVTQFKISPEFVAGSTLPQARITLQQQVSSNITFTYSQDLSQANSELIRIELQMTPRFSAVATRDENGIFGVDFYYKKQFR